MQHRGEIVKNAVYQSGYSITKIALLLGRSRRWMYQMFDNANVSLDIVLKIGEIIHKDFSSEIKELKISKIKQSEILIVNKTEEHWKNKYFMLLEEYNQLLKRD